MAGSALQDLLPLLEDNPVLLEFLQHGLVHLLADRDVDASSRNLPNPAARDLLAGGWKMLVTILQWT